MSNYQFTTISDVQSQLTGVLDWEWSGDASYDDFCEYFWRNHTNEEYDRYDDNSGDSEELRDARDSQFKAVLKNYLLSVGENPSEYSV